ncbi:MAG: hypothetical protein ACHQET_08590 [Chitinophagales bacterium]
MKRSLATFICTINFLAMKSQTFHENLSGSYFLQGVVETASGFRLNPDSSFEFFYSYGALDRYGKGKWSFRNNKIILESRKRPDLDFKMLEAKSTTDDSITIAIKDNNEILLRYVDCRIKTKSGMKEMRTNEEGIAKFPKEPFDSLAFLFRLCPDRYSAFPVPAGMNYFEIGFESWIVEVFFEDFELKHEKDHLTGRHPLLKGDQFTYVKSGKEQ